MKMAFLVNLGQAMQAYSVPCWWVSWWLWGAGCISQETYLLYEDYLMIRTTMIAMRKRVRAAPERIPRKGVKWRGTV